MTPEQAVGDIVKTLREAADRISRGENVALILATDFGGPSNGGAVFMFAPPQVAADLSLRILGAALNLGHQTQTKIAEGPVIRLPNAMTKI